MTVILNLTTDEQDQVIATHDGAPLGEPTPLTSLARIDEKSNPYRFDPYGLGARLFAALGGPALLALLDADAPDYALHLVVDERTAPVPWEYASPGAGRFLACEYAILRLLPGARPAPSAKPGPINFVALAADPLVDKDGRPRTGYRLQADAELAAVAARLSETTIALNARRIPPTVGHLQAALGVGPAVLHLTCHGTLVSTPAGDLAVLQLEDADGMAAPLRADRLLRLPPARGAAIDRHERLPDGHERRAS